MASALRFTILMIAITAFARVSTAANYTVTTGSGSGTGSLAWAINSANAAGAGPHTITVSPSVTTISISANLPVISTSVSIEGNGTRIVGNSRQLFVVNSGTVALRNMNVTGGRATGGTGGSGSGGGGGGLGAGGGLFVNAGAVVTVENVSFDANQARGGTGGATSSAEGGGGGGGFRGNGGAGGNGTNIGGGGGGGGLVGTGGTGSTGGGGGGGGGTSNGSNGSGANGGNGNGGGGKGGNISANGGAGSTPGGGGGGGQNATGGTGADFGGGGGGGGLKAGAAGGFGAGGGGAGISSTGGAGGFGGGNGGDAGKSGGGGSGFGGAVFVRQGGSLTVINSSMTATNSVGAGTGSVAGQSAGSNLYVMSGVNATFGGTGTSQLAGSISGDGGLVKNDSGTLNLSGTNNYTGGTTVSGGKLQGTTSSLQGSITNNANVEFNQATSGTYAGTMSGTGSLTKAGTGTVTLSGPNTYSGGTTVSGGKLQGTTTSLQGNITNNANVEFNQSTTGTYAGTMSGTGSLTKAGTGTVTLSGPNSYSGGTTVSGGVLKGTTSSLQGNITNNATTEFDQTTNGTYAGTMSGSGGLVKSGTGTVTLSGPNTYSGGTTVSGGTLKGTTTSLQGNITNNATTEFDQTTNGTYAGTMSGSGSLVKSGTGTVTLSGPNSYSGGTTVSGGKLQGTTSSLQGNITNNANVEFSQSTNGTYSGAMSGSGALVKSGTGTVTLSGPNSYSGGTTVSGGKLQGTTSGLQGNITNNAAVEFNQTTNGTHSGAITGSGSLVKSGTGTVTLSGPNSYSGGTTVSGGKLQGTTSSLQGNITNNANVEFSQSTNGTYSGSMSGTGALEKTGTGTVTLSGPNTYAGGTTVSGGTLKGTTSSLQGNITNNATTEFDQATNGTYAGTMSGSGSLVKSGTGTVTLSGPNTYSGGTTVSGGTLKGTTTSLQGNITNNATTEFDQNITGTYSGAMSGTGALVKNGTGTVTLSGPNSYSGGTTVSGGKLQGTTSGLQGNITNNAAVEFNQTTNGTHSGAITGSGSLVKSGTGTVTLSGPNSYSGGTTVSGGVLKGTTSSLQGNITNNATTEFDQATNGTYAGTVSGSGTLVKNGTGTVTLSGPNTYSGGTTVSGGTLKGTTTSLQGNITNNATTEFDQNTNGTYAGTMSGSGALVKSGTGTVTLSGPNSYSGGTTVSGGKLQGTTSGLQGNINNNAAVEFNQTTTGTHSGAITGSGSLVKSGTGTVTLSGPNSYSGGTTVSGGTLKGTTSSLQGNITNNAATEFDQNTNGTYTGTMSGSGSLAKSGSGTVTLNGPNFYSGGTTVNGGTLRGTTDSLQGNITNNATTEFDQSTNGTYAGTMSGAGALVKSGTGTVTLSGPNSYTGGTTVSGGTLRGTTTSLQGDVTNNATTEFDQNTDGTYAGTMSGSGTLVKNGTGTVTLSGPNSYSGGTTVSGGKLQGTTSSLQGDITNNAITEFDQNTSGVYAGTMNGSGALVKNGTGTVTLTGPNSYSGGTTVSGGKLQGTTSSLQGDITNNAITEFDQNTSGAYGGTISGSGALVKNGTGTVTLTGPNSYSGGTTVSGGTLRGTTTSLQGNITNNATTEFDQNTDGTYAGSMSGSGALVKGGTGTVTLSGPNSYSGGTTVNGGTLRGTTDSLQGNITNNATTEFDQSTNGTYAGAMSGTGTLAKSGTGTVTLSGPNSYSGGTTVSGGTLRGTTSSLQGDITNNATTEFDQNTSGAYGGTITGSGALVKNGTGTVTLNGPNFYSGGTTVNGGTLRGTTDSLQGNITNNATTEFDQNTDGTYAGTMSGSGALVKNGAGTVTLTGPNSYSGGTTVDGGVLKGNTTSLQGNIINNATAEFDQNADGTYTGTMSGSGALVKRGAGTVTLTGPNSYSGGTTVSGGMLRGTTDSLQGNITNNAATEFDQNTDGAYAGAMSGSGALLKNGSGTVTLTGPNSYAGGTTVNQGTLRGTTSSLQGNITNNATTEFDQNTDGTYAGTMSGSGGLIKSGTGTVTLSGPNSFAGGTTVQGGTLRGTTDSLQGDITNNATTEFDQTTNGTYAGSMSGTGALVKSGTGTVTLTGPNSYSGGTTVNDGVLQGDATSLQGNIANNAHVTFGQTGDGIYGGAISGSGGVTKSGAGVLTMNGHSSYTGTTNIDAGGLIVNGNLTSDVTVASGATLDGSGNILGNVTNYGTVGTGNSIGTRTFGGTYTQQAGSILEVEINDGGTTPGVNSDLIQAQSVVLNGGTVSVLAAPGNYLGGSQYRFLSSTTAIVGQFDGIMIDPSAYALTLGYEYDAGLYWAYFTFDSEFSTFAQTANQLAIANYLDSISTGATGDLQVVLTGLDSLAGDPDAMRAAFDSMTDQAAPTMATVGLQNTTLVVQQLAGQLRSGSLGIGGDGTAFTEPAARASSGPVVLVSYNKGSAPVVSFVTDESCQRWNGWTMGYGLGGSAQSDGNAAGLTYGMGGTLLGLDRSLGDEGRLGFFGGYQGTGLQLTDLSQSGSINGGMLGSYIYQDDGFNYYSAISGLQFNGYETTRRIAFDGIDRTARGNFSGWQGYGYLERGVNLRGNRATLQPYAALQYIYLRQNSYTETGADTLNLANSGIDANSLRSLVGSRLQTSYTTRGGHLLYPELRALWLHEFLETDMVVNSFFAPIGGSSFATDGLNLGRDWAIVGGGLRYELPSGWQLVANYDVQANTQQVFHVGSGSLQYAW